MEEHIVALNDRDLSQNSIKKYLEILSSFYSYAMKRPHFEGITGNPAAVVMEEISRVRRDGSDCATWGNACKMINHTPDPRDKTIQIVLAKTGPGFERHYRSRRSSNKGNRLSKERIRREIQNTAARASVVPKDERRFEKKFTPHTFRTVFTNLMRNQAIKRHVLKYIRGDSKTETMDVYTLSEYPIRCIGSEKVSLCYCLQFQSFREGSPTERLPVAMN